MKGIILSLILATVGAVSLHAEGRKETLLSEGWQFHAGTGEGETAPEWTEVSVPHDWAIGGPFDKKWDLQRVAIVQNGETSATEKSGRSGALPWIGEGHYRRIINISEGTEHAELVFDGAMSEPVVSLGGQKAGCWAYGYNTFRIDITPFMHTGENLLEVGLKNMEESSRWYPGAGIYRPVTLVETRRTYIDDWSLFVRPLDEKKVREGERVEMQACFDIAGPSEHMRCKVEVSDAEGNRLADVSLPELAGGKAVAVFSVANAHLWTPESPTLYNIVVRLFDGDLLVDEKSTRFGIRTVSVSAKGGFRLNGQGRKLKGVCLHHDLGPLGAAVNKAALIRQIKILKDMGCDAIRTAHNMPSQWQMEVCDSLGMMVMAESFDMWIYPKCKNGYGRFFREWADRDLSNLVRAHRNHPSIVMWSIGNEIPEQGMQGGREMALHLQDLCHQLDPTRPVTQGCDRPDNALSTGFLQLMDVPGLNYRLHRYQNTFDHLWQGFLLGTETASTVSSRGVYYFPVEPSDRAKHPDGQCTGYDVEWCPWSNLPDDDWRWQDDKPWVIGEFVWTGFDYLGEPTPYDEYWPSRSSYFGICDLAGLPKDRFYLYRSKWQTEDHTIHLLPHWTWGAERHGEVTPVYCYTDYPAAELFLNGKSQGRREKNPAERLDRYRLRWNDVRYEPGELRVVVFDKEGRPAGEQVLRTAAKPSKLKLDVWTQHEDGTLVADGNDLAFITVSLVDKHGTFVPNADDRLTFEVTGAGQFQAVCNGDATSLEPFTEPTMKLFSGQLVLVVRSHRQAGTIQIKVRDPQRKLSKSLTIPVKNR